MASSKVAEYARKMREKKLAEVRKTRGGAEVEKMTSESILVSGFFRRGILFPIHKSTHRKQLYDTVPRSLSSDTTLFGNRVRRKLVVTIRAAYKYYLV